MKSPIVLLQGLLDDFSRLEPGVKGLDRDIITIKNRFECEGYGFLSISLPSLCKALDRGLAERRFACPMGFKKLQKGTIPRLFSGMFCEIFDPVSGTLKDNPPSGIIKNLRQVLMFFKKIQMPSSTEITLEKKAVSEFFSTDEIAGNLILDSRTDHLLGLVSSYVLNGLSSKDNQNTRDYKHGPGAVFEGLSSNQKWSELVEAIKNDDFDTEAHGYADFGAILSETDERARIDVPEGRICLKAGASRSSARLISVPKNSTSRRTITIEPTVNQFVQQGLNSRLRDEIVACPILGNSLALTDQSKNQILALEGSLYDNWATIDLKSASDLLTVKLVERVFDRHSQFFDYMMDCRSPYVEYENNRTKLWKFAGMGNALTFPVQSVCFAIVCYAAIMDQEGTRPTYWNLKRASRHVRIYGDDIIIKAKYANQVVNWLTKVGLKVNDGKSFLTGNFKESCGVDAFMGVDITPIYLKHLPDSTSTKPSAIKSLVETSNHLWMQGLYTASTVIKNEVEERLGKSLPLVSRSSEALGWHSRLDAMTPTRWNRSLHRLETRALVLVSLKRKDRLDGYAALLKSFHVPLLGRGKDHLQQSPIRFRHRIRQKWVPAKAG